MVELQTNRTITVAVPMAEAKRLLRQIEPTPPA